LGTTNAADAVAPVWMNARRVIMVPISLVGTIGDVHQRG
jgi:hypothetical protein